MKIKERFKMLETLDLTIVQNKEFGELEVVQEDGKYYFPATSVATILGYTNPQKAIRDHCKNNGVTFRSVVIESKNQTVDKKFISEGNVYRLIARSKLPQAEKFEEWVFDEVLPNIRQNGFYMTDEYAMNLLDNPEFVNGMMSKISYKFSKEISASTQNTYDNMYDTIKELDSRLSSVIYTMREQGITIKEPNYPKEIELALSYDKTRTENSKKYSITVGSIPLYSDKLYTASNVGLILGFGSGRATNKILESKGVQYKDSAGWHINEKYKDKGYVEVYENKQYTSEDGVVPVQMKWTMEGVAWLGEMFGREVLGKI